MSTHKLNSIIQFVKLPNGTTLTLVTNPRQIFALKEDKGRIGSDFWYLSDCTQKTTTLIEATKKFFPQHFPNIIYV